MYRQNLAHFVKFPSVVAAQLAESSSEISFAAVQNLSQKLACLEGSIASMVAPGDAKRPCERANQRLLGLVNDTGDQKCCFLP